MAEEIRFYFDEHMPRAVERGLRERGYEVIMAVDEGMIGKDDDNEHLPFAAAKNAVLCTQDYSFSGRVMNQRSDHSGFICWTGKGDDFGGMIHAFVEFAELYTPDDVVGQVFWLK